MRVHQQLVSFVLDLGGAYKKGLPVRSLYNFRLLIQLCDKIGFHLAEEFFWYNPSKLPSPIEWVNKRKVRAKDSVNTVWWLSKSENPKADIRNVLVPYSERMQKLIKDPSKYYSPKQGRLVTTLALILAIITVAQFLQIFCRLRIQNQTVCICAAAAAWDHGTPSKIS